MFSFPPGPRRRGRLILERLEERCLLSGSPPPVPVGPLPAVTLGLTAEQVAHADVVIDWNATALRAVWNDATPPTASSRVLALVGVAVYDAVDGVHPNYDFYPVPGLTARPAPDASRAAAAIAAADTVLNGLYPAQRPLFAAEYQATLDRIHGGKPKADGIAWGQAVGNAVLAWRGHDGAGNPSSYQPAPPGGPPGVYELTPGDTFALSPEWGQVTPWAMSDPAQFLPPAPPALSSAQYAVDFNRTKLYGGTTSTVRTPDETLFAHFWADVPGHSVTPPGHWDEIAEHLALQGGLNLEQNAHLFGLLNLGLADAAICCWDAKYVYNFWRPVTAINDPRANQLNPATTSDPTWAPLWKTPNFPSYTSGHSTFSGAASAILASVFGDHTGFTIGSDDLPGYSRSFGSFRAAADEAGESRVMGGIHFEFDNSAGLAVGRELGHMIAGQFLQPRGALRDNFPGGPQTAGPGPEAGPTDDVGLWLVQTDGPGPTGHPRTGGRTPGGTSSAWDAVSAEAPTV